MKWLPVKWLPVKLAPCEMACIEMARCELACDEKYVISDHFVLQDVLRVENTLHHLGRESGDCKHSIERRKVSVFGYVYAFDINSFFAI